MEKTALIILLSFIMLNTSLFAMNQEQEAAKNEKAQISKKDYAKIAAASIGTCWFSFAALTAWYDLIGSKLPFFALCPLISLALPMLFADAFLLGNEASDAKKPEVSYAKELMIVQRSGILAGVLASSCGLYLYKKLSEIRKKRAVAQADR